MIKSLYYGAIAKMTGKHSVSAPKDFLKEQLTEKRRLPVGMTEFDEWSERIISGAMLVADEESQKFTLANLILSLGPTDAFVEDVYFIKALLKLAANQIADAKRTEIREKVKARLAEEAKAKMENDIAAANTEVASSVLEDKKILTAAN